MDSSMAYGWSSDILINGEESSGPCITNVIATCRKNFSQWESSFLWKLRCHWLKFLRRVAKTLVIRGPGLPRCPLCRLQWQRRLSSVRPPVQPASTWSKLRQTPVPNDTIFVHHNGFLSISRIENKNVNTKDEGPVDKLPKPSWYLWAIAGS